MPPGRRIPIMHALFRGASVIPVLTIDRERDAVPLARALGEGGLSVIEVALRSAASYLALPNVPMVGGSWMAPKEAIAAGDWPRIRRLAERAAAIGRAEAA